MELSKMSQESPKSNPKQKQIDVGNAYVFGVDFEVAWTLFWKGFCHVFQSPNGSKKPTVDFCKKLTKHCVGAGFFDVGSCDTQRKSDEIR